MFAQAVEELGKVEGDLTKRRNSANATLALLTKAASLVAQPEVNAKKQTQAHLHMGGRRAEAQPPTNRRHHRHSLKRHTRFDTNISSLEHTSLNSVSTVY